MLAGLILAVWLFGSITAGVLIFDGDFWLTLMLMGLSCIILMLIIFPIYYFKDRKKQKEWAKEHALAFYEECRRNGITGLAWEGNRKKAELILNKPPYKSDHVPLEQYFAEGKAQYEQRNQQKIDRMLNDKRQEQQKQCDAIQKYCQYEGRQKRIAMLKDRRDESKKRAEQYSSGAMNMLTASQQKEGDWALMGGLASGLAGGAAGLATALNVQAKNAQIREQNAKNIEMLAPAVAQQQRYAAMYRKEAADLEEKIDAAGLKLVSDKPKEEVFKLLTLSTPRVEVQETGACLVKLKVKAPSSLTIYDSVPAVIDGVLRAEIEQDSCKLGEAFLLAPVFGFGKDTEIQGWCMCHAEKGFPCSARVAPYKLWEMEA